MAIDRDIYFDYVRDSLFGGRLTQDQVDGQNGILDVWETHVEPRHPGSDLRWLAYMLATTKHETASEMIPIEEYGKGAGHPYGEKDPETGQTYYGRGDIQTTWRENYRKADVELAKLGINTEGENSSEWHADNQLKPRIAAGTMFVGMYEGWFRSDSKGRQTLPRWFSATVDDAYMAREIINGDKTKIPDWSGGVSIGNLIKDYHKKFLAALEAAHQEPAPAPEPEPDPKATVSVSVDAPPEVDVVVRVRGELQ